MHILDHCLQQPFRSLDPLFKKAEEVRRERWANRVFFYAPSMVRYETSYYKNTSRSFPAISVTGGRCYLNCDHCGGLLLESMLYAETPERLYHLMKMVVQEGGRGCLISGGCNPLGYVPLEPFLPVIARVKREASGFEVVVHTGLASPRIVELLADTGVDAVLVDIVGSDKTLEEVCHLKRGVVAFEEMLRTLKEHSLPVAPHIVVGMHYGRLLGEKAALDLIARFSPAAVVIVALMPLKGTKMMGVDPPKPQDVARVMLAARLLMPDTPLVLGCARPRGIYRVAVDALSLRCGVNGITYPSEAFFSICRARGIGLVASERCCGLIWRDIARAGSGVQWCEVASP